MIPVKGFEGKRVAVFGLGRTGLTAARALLAGGATVEGAFFGETASGEWVFTRIPEFRLDVPNWA